MTIELSTPALLFPAIAILMLGYVNRYVSTASVIRSFKKDYDTGYVHTNIVTQLTVLKRRIELSRLMITIGALALMLACLSMLFIFLDWQDAGAVSFGAALLAMVTTTLLSVYETTLSNRSLLVEIHDVIAKESAKSQH